MMMSIFLSVIVVGKTDSKIGPPASMGTKNRWEFLSLYYDYSFTVYSQNIAEIRDDCILFNHGLYFYFSQFWVKPVNLTLHPTENKKSCLKHCSSP